MRVLALTPSYYPSIGGIESVIKQIAINCQSHGIIVDVAHVSLDNKNFTIDYIDGVKVFRIPLYGHRLIGIGPSIAKIVKNYNIMHVHDPQLMTITFNSIIFGGSIPRVLSTHGGFFHTKKYKLIKILHRKFVSRNLLKFYKSVLASSKTDFNCFSKLSKNVVDCGNGIDFKLFNKASVIKRDGCLRWVYWGRLSTNKNIESIIDYLNHCHKLGFIVRLLICGNDFDSVLPSLQWKIKNYGLESFVEFKTYMEEASLISELSNRDIFITATKYEGFGLSIVEAMSAGMLVICRDIEPLNFFIENMVSGFFLTFDNTEHDIDRLFTILTLSKERLDVISSNAINVAKIYDWEFIVCKYIYQYNKATNLKI